jgi:hypothetical protein
VGIQRKKVNWILDADVLGFFDNVSQVGVRRDDSHRERWELANEAFLDNAMKNMPRASNVRVLPKG